MSSEDVIELSVEETNKLRAKLGLKPLRIGNEVVGAESSNVLGETPSQEGGKAEEEEALELSVDETNKLRAKLGLAPLRGTNNTGKSKEIHKPAENTGSLDEAAQRIEQAKLRRQVQEGAVKVFGSSTLNDDDDDDKASLSWAERMRQQAKAPKKIKKDVQPKNGGSEKGNNDYNEADLEGMQVRNSMAGLEAGEDAVLTLADTSILKTDTLVSNKVVGINDEEDALENIKLTENEKQRDGLRKKRMLEMGMGRAGGYAGFDDDEFEELGGTLGPSSQGRHSGEGNKKVGRGFRLGSQINESEDTSRTDFDKVMSGEAISLVSKGDVVTSDYMTREEELEAKQKKRKKETKFKKKKKIKKKKRRRVETNDEEDEDTSIIIPNPAKETISDANLLSKLERTADSDQSISLQKRRTIDDDGDDEMKISLGNSSNVTAEKDSLQQSLAKQTDYNKIMEKGNERTKKAFNTDVMAEKKQVMITMDDEPDDSFLDAALAKARRLNRLREMNKVSSGGAAAVAEAVRSTTMENGSAKKPSGISFSIDDTREFSRAMRARTQQKERMKKVEAEANTTDAGVGAKDGDRTTQVNTSTNSDELIKQESMEDDREIEDENINIEELAKEVKEDDIHHGFDGSNADSVGVGRGLSSFVSMLKTTGEITGKHGGKEELRGRAKDERNYDNYEPLDLSQVVSIGENATSKDRELANREIKLEYRDSHGRLLTQKEAYRDLCYQFHGHGASKRKEEKRLQQIAREQAEARMASRQVSAARDGTTAGTLGALKATQKATGKAFINFST